MLVAQTIPPSPVHNRSKHTGTDMQAGSEWRGTLVVRLLPDSVNGDYEAVKLSSNPPISPSSIIQPTTQPAAAAPDSSFDDDSLVDDWKLDDCSCVALDIHVADGSATKPQESVSFHMNRPPAEKIDKALQRLGLSLMKKLFKNQKGKGAKKMPDIQYALKWSDGTEVDVSTQTHGQVWKQSLLAKNSKLTVHLTIEDIPFHLDVQCCPPTLVSTHAYEKFGSRVFVGIPLVVTVKSIFATHTVVDWYVNGKLALKDNVSYTPTAVDAGKPIAVIVTVCRDDSHSRPEGYQFQHIVEERPRNAILDLRPDFCLARQTNNNLRVLSYNILADLNAFSVLAQTSFYPYCDAKFIVKERRLPLILHEILQYQADVVCLQEVDHGVFHGLLLPVLQHRGYQGFFSSKQGTREGGAIFWSLRVFEAVPESEQRSVPIRDLFVKSERLDDWQSMKDIFKLLDQLPDLNTIVRDKLGHMLQTVTLNRRDGAHQKVIVGNTHIFFHPMASHIRLIQLFACFHRMQIERQDSNAPVIFCGDLNSSPSSGAARLFFDREVGPSCGTTDKGSTWKHLHTFSWERDYKDPAIVPEDTPEPPTVRLEDSFPILCSGYPQLPVYTHYIQNFASTLDYILVSQDTFQPVASAAMPSEAILTEHVAMPSEVLPSDHICLVCDLKWI
jgi:mRNA deadenylase 3'-5' endonuclease subunit Ccr4